MKKLIITIFTILMIFNTTACKKKSKKKIIKPEIPPVVEFNTIKDLVAYHVKCIKNGYINAALRSTMKKELFIKKIFKQVDKSKDKSAYAADVHWRTFHAGKRLWGIHKAIKRYKGKLIKLDHIGKPKEVIPFKGFSFIRRLTVFFIVQKENGQQLSVPDNNYFGIIVKINNKYQLLHIYWD